MLIELLRRLRFSVLQLIAECINFFIQLYLRLKHGSEFENLARVYQVLWRYKPPERLDFSRFDDFVGVIERCVHPELILDDAYTLYSVSPRDAVFVCCGHHDVFDSTHHAFVYNAQFALAQHVVVLPIKSFYRVASSVKNPDVPLVHLPNHGRCGSTLLTRLFEAIPGSLSVSETNAFTDLVDLSQRGVVSRTVLKDMCYAVIMCTVKHCNSRNSKLLFLKLQNIATYITDVIIETHPQMKQLYMYRQPLGFVRSYEKLNFGNNWEPLDAKMGVFWSGIGKNHILQRFPNQKYVFFAEHLSPFARLALIWITGVAAFHELVSRHGNAIASLKFEDLLENPWETMRGVLKGLDVDQSLLPDVDAVMAKDSQAGSEYTSRNVDRLTLERVLTPITETLRKEIDAMCVDFEVPSFWEDVRLPKDIRSLIRE